MRLDKFLTEMQIGTRSEVKKYIKNGLVAVDGNSNVKPEQKIEPNEQKVTFRGKEINYQPYEYYMLNKPSDCVTARNDNLHKTVMDFIDGSRKDLSPVGRLDLDTTGLLLITNDGMLSHMLLSPTKHAIKRYEARVDGFVTEEDKTAFRNGLNIGDDTPTKPAELVILEAAETSLVQVTVTEGRFHQIKRMFAAVKKPVLTLKRLQMGTLLLDETLAEGEYRKLTDEEIKDLKLCVQKKEQEI